MGWTSKSGEDNFQHVFDGEISDVQIFSTAFSAEEIADLHAGLAVTPSQPNPDDVVPTSPEDTAPTAEPDPEPEPEEPIVAPTPDQDFDGVDDDDDPESDGGYNVDHANVIILEGKPDVVAGRVSTLDTGEDNIDSIRVIDGPAHGNLTVNPDNTLALVLTLSEKTSDVSFSYEVTYENGSTKTFTKSVDVVPGSQDEGWAEGQFYMLEEDEDGDVVIEHGDVHRKVYVSESNDALTLNDIADLEGMSVNQITTTWLENSEYGTSEDLALETSVGMDLWHEITGNGEKTSHWLLFERGYEYNSNDLGDYMIDRNSHGESELNPMFIGAWGDGDRPVINQSLDMYKNTYSNIVIQGLKFTQAGLILNSENILIDDSTFSSDGTFAIQESAGFTFRNSAIYDTHKDNPSNGTNWENEMGDRIQGVFIRGTEGLLIEDMFIDQVGWEDGYSYDLSQDTGQAPSILSHNIYIQNTNTDVTLRDTISMQASGYGAQVRPGGFVEDNAFIGNNSGLSVVGGDYKNAGPIGHYSLVTGNLVTDAGYRDTNGRPGALSEGILNTGEDTSLVDNIVTHLADPNSNELDYKYWNHDAVDNKKDAFLRRHIGL